ncbi:MAG: hypothetical protein ACYCQJ_14815 [Nitrososphaerales archaeon]
MLGLERVLDEEAFEVELEEHVGRLKFSKTALSHWLLEEEELRPIVLSEAEKSLEEIFKYRPSKLIPLIITRRKGPDVMM